MAAFTKNKTVPVNTEADVEVNIDISVNEFYQEMSSIEEKDMLDLLRDDMSPIELVDTLDDKAKFYKDLAYHLGVTDSDHLDALITELQYWSKK